MAEGGKALTRTPSNSSRKRTSSLGSPTDTQSGSLSSPEQILHAPTDASDAVAPAWTGPRSGSAPPEGRSRLATLACESIPVMPQVEVQKPAEAQGVASFASASKDDAQQDRMQPQIDKLLLDGLAVAKDRLLLLRADLEMEKLFNDVA